MAGDHHRRQAVSQRNRLFLLVRFWLLSVSLPIVLTFPGCGTGGPELTSENEKTGELEANFLLGDSTPLPGNHKQKVIIVSARRDNRDQDDNQPKGDKKNISEPDSENFRVKPNHWIAVQNEGFSKKEDFNGTLTHSMRMNNLRPRSLYGTRYFLRTRRPASLAKEQPKKFEAPAFVPDEENITIAPELLTRGGSDVVTELDRLLPLQPHQYHMVLLTEAPETYRFMTVLPSIWNLRLNRYLQNINYNVAQEEIDFSTEQDALEPGSLSYKLTISDWDDAPELPSNVQQWTSIAYLIWADRFSPDDLSVDQKQAIVDWLHFGGQIIVSAEAIEMLSDSFLGPYLPVRPTGKENSTGEQMNQLVARWSLEKDTNGKLVSPTFTKNDKLVLTTWKEKAEAVKVPNCGGLVVEQEVGRGRITCIAFALNYNKLRSWSGFDNWFNGALLRRPGRQFNDLELLNTFTENDTVDGFKWRDLESEAYQPSLYSNMRFLSRDWDVDDIRIDPATNTVKSENVSSLLQLSETERRFIADNPNFSPGAWDDYSDFATAARSTLKDQAGITPPKRDWVLKALLAYLAVLVPANYIVFRLIGKLEWAWFSIPLISIIGGISVVRAASLDIGFSNKQLQINIVEIVPDYERAHVTGYGSLYSSLTTSFRYASDNPTTLALPFPTANVSTKVDEARPTEFTFNVGKSVKFGPQSVLSNTMEMFHFEQLASIGGTIGLMPNGNLENQSNLKLEDGFVLRHNSSANQIEFARVDQLESGQVTQLKWNKLSEMKELYQQFSSTPFCYLEHELNTILERLAAAEIVFDTTSWDKLATFYATSEPEFSKAIVRIAERRQIQPGGKFTYGIAMEALKEARLSEELNLGRFSRIAAHYPLGPGEVRLFAWSTDRIHDFKIEPNASQTEVKNFIVAQLVRPALPRVEKDANLAYRPKNTKAETDKESEAIDPDEY